MGSGKKVGTPGEGKKVEGWEGTGERERSSREGQMSVLPK